MGVTVDPMRAAFEYVSNEEFAKEFRREVERLRIYEETWKKPKEEKKGL